MSHPHIPTPRTPPKHVFAAIVGSILALVAVLVGLYLPSLWWLSDDEITAAEAEAACVRIHAPTSAEALDEVRRHCRAIQRSLP